MSMVIGRAHEERSNARQYEGVDGGDDGRNISNEEEHQRFHNMDNVTHDNDDVYDGDGGCDDIPRDENAYGLHS
ncbi:hypothetical protein FNV43_RR01143 [Rhamnella rubrinervis]|uniref:Uncharacterized protein n=1 Tax=Rhamnella rubrinervis TaxID=2594499 RepID=A0A8K0HPA4_9ROSA|nr:hypothetical protein FNV43_RR01143 [Rhamnella rubrinervis]